MAISAAQLIAIVSVQGANAARAQLLGVGVAADDAGARLRTLAGVGIAGLAVGLIAAGVGVTKMAADFQQGVNRLKTGAGDVTDNLQKMGQGILKVSTTTGILTSGTDGLNAAMYQIISTGQRGAQALDTLSVSAKGAQIEQANTVDVSKALTTAMTDYGTKQFNATQFMNGFIVAVQRGKITLEELSTAMSPIMPVASDLGISFADLSAAMVTQTDAGINAARAATGLRFLMQSLENPTHKAATEMKAMGLSSTAAAEEMKVSLPGALQLIYDAAKKAGPEGSVPFNRAVSDMIGGQRSLAAFLALTGTHMTDFVKNSTAVTAAMKKSATEVLGWNTAQTNLNVQLDRGKAVLAAIAIQAGTQLLPVVTQLVKGFADWASHTDFSGLLSTLATIGIRLSEAWGFMQKIGGFVVNSQSWKDTATNIGGATKELGNFLAAMQKVGANQSGKGGAFQNIVEGAGQVGSAVSDTFDHVFTLLSNIALAANGTAHTMSTVQEAVFQMNGTIVQGALTVKDATGLMALGYTHVKDNITGADIALKTFVTSGGKVTSTTLSMNDALKLLGDKAGHILSAADAARLLALGVKSVDDTAHHASVSMQLLANSANAVGVNMATLALTGVKVTNGVTNMSGALKILGESAGHVLNVRDAEILMADGVTHVNDKLLGTIDLQKIINNYVVTLKIQAQQVIKAQYDAAEAHRLLTVMNGPYTPIVHDGNIIQAKTDAQSAYDGLIKLKGPFTPNVNDASVLNARTDAQSTYGALVRLNGTSSWNSYVNTVYTTTGQAVTYLGHAAGITNNPTGHLAMIGEKGPELMYIPKGASIYPHGTGPSGGSIGGDGGGSKQPVTINVHIAGRHVGQVLLPDIVAGIRSAVGTVAT